MRGLECSFLEGSVCTINATRKPDAIIELIRKSAVLHVIENTDKFAEKVLSREREQTTGFGHGIAVAHAQYSGIDSVIISLGVSRKGIDYESMDNLPVQLLFLIASPPSLQDEYLTALSALVKLIRNSGFRSLLLRASTLREIEEVLHTNFCSLLRKEKTYSS